MNGYTYSAKEILGTARRACKGLGRYIRWELRLGTAHVSLVVYYLKDGRELTTNIAI